MKYSTLHEMMPLGGGTCLSLFSPTYKVLQRCAFSEDSFHIYLIDDAGSLTLRSEKRHYMEGPLLLLTAPGFRHQWECSSEHGLSGLVIRFPADLLSRSFLGKAPMQPIDTLLKQARNGIAFPIDTFEGIAEKIRTLEASKGGGSFLELLTILHELSTAEGGHMLGEEQASEEEANEAAIQTAVLFMKENYARPITLEDVADKAQMSRGAFCRHIRKRTGKTYLESLNEIRMEQVCRMLTGTSANIQEIAYESGYNHVTYFNRWFKRWRGCTPKEFRKQNPAA